jgi:hypothetical protein
VGHLFPVDVRQYGLRLLPAMAALDNFYGEQRADGYIQRVYSRDTGHEVAVPSASEPMVNPTLFAWAERGYWRFTGDASRLARVAPSLYWQTDLGSGMDNVPRGDIAGAGWEDMSMQQALAAMYLAEMGACARPR